MRLFNLNQLTSIFFIFLMRFNILSCTDIHKFHKFNLHIVDDVKPKSKVKMEGKIVGGVPVPIERYPFAVLVFNMGSLCAGTILNSWSVLSAAHCFVHNDDVYDMTVHVGALHKYDSNSELYDVSHLVVHDDYNKAMPFACDIAMLFVASKIEFGDRVKRVILVNDGTWMSANEKNFTVTGWGMIRYNGPVSDMGLLMTSLQFVPRQECEKLHSLTLTKDMFCLYGEGQRDTCKGDSGGGVLWHGLLVGIVSHGDGCAGVNKPSVYSNVWFFRNWIQDTINNYFCTYCGLKRRFGRMGNGTASLKNQVIK